MKDLNPHKQSQSLSCCHYTNPQDSICIALCNGYYYSRAYSDCQVYFRKKHGVLYIFLRTKRSLRAGFFLFAKKCIKPHVFCENILDNPNMLCYNNIRCREQYKLNLGDLCNGSTTDSDSVCEGSNPSSPAKNLPERSSGRFYFFTFHFSLNRLEKFFEVRSDT